MTKEQIKNRISEINALKSTLRTQERVLAGEIQSLSNQMATLRNQMNVVVFENTPEYRELIELEIALEVLNREVDENAI